MATDLEVLIARAEGVLRQVTSGERRELIKATVLSDIYEIHATGRLLLRGIDRRTYDSYSALFAASPGSTYAWDVWNAYVIDQFQRCISVLRTVSRVGSGLARDITAAKVFISHGKFGPTFTKLEAFIRAIGCLPVYDVEEPTAGRTINQHVQHLFEEADFFVVLAAAETTNADGTRLPNHNVMVELDRLQRERIDRMLLLVESGCKMPSMLQDVIWQSYTADCMDQAFTKLAAELTRLALI